MYSRLSVLGILVVGLSVAASAQGVLELENGARAAKVPVSAFGWLEGSWHGTGFGGVCDEAWLAPVDRSMQGMFRYTESDTVRFTEYMAIVENDTATLLRLKHFRRDLSPWEEKDKWVTFPLVKAEGQTAWFSGLTYHRDADTLTILLNLKTGDNIRTEQFQFYPTGK